MMITDLRSAFEIGQHTLTFKSLQSEVRDDFVVEHIWFETAAQERVRAILTRPSGGGPWPAIQYIHAHGNRWDIGADELLHGRPALLGALGPEFARRGYVTLMLDMPTFGSRSGESESAGAKARLWRGRSLAGQMLGELASALDYLEGRSDVDAARIGVFGISMGATLGYWLAAVDQRCAATAHLCCYADLGTLIATGAHDLHGSYLTIPGLLNIAANGEIAGLIAPRPQLICVGLDDPLTPPAAVEIALAQTRAAYASAPDALEEHCEAGVGHKETSAMRDKVMRFFARTLG